MTDIDGGPVCDPCVDGEHERCLGDDDVQPCMCIDMEHSGDRYGEVNDATA